MKITANHFVSFLPSHAYCVLSVCLLQSLSYCMANQTVVCEEHEVLPLMKRQRNNVFTSVSLSLLGCSGGMWETESPLICLHYEAQTTAAGNRLQQVAPWLPAFAVEFTCPLCVYGSGLFRMCSVRGSHFLHPLYLIIGQNHLKP